MSDIVNEIVENYLNEGPPDEQERNDTDLRERLRKTIKNDIERANSFYEEKVEPVLRERHQLYEADKKYYAKRFNKLSKQSDFVSYDFWSFVQWAIPAVMNSFFGADEAVAIVGRGPEDVPRANVMRDLIKYQLMTQNKGYTVFADWFSDAFQYNLGAVKCYWRRITDYGEPQVYTDAPPDRLFQMQQDPMCKILDVQQDPFTGLYTIQYQTIHYTENRPVLEPIRVTDLRWSPDAKSLSEANFVAQKKLVTANDLRRAAKEGAYNPDAVERAIEKGSEVSITQSSFEAELTDNYLNRAGQNEADDESARQLFELYECYVKIDANDDGLLEDMLVTMVNDEMLRIEPNEWGRVPIFTVCPVHDPFRVLAPLSLAEIVGEIQSLKVAFLRQIIVNTANVNNLQHFVDKTKVNLNDIDDNRQFIRVMGDPHTVATPVPQGNLAPWSMPFLEFLETCTEQWTGRTRYNQGMDSSSLNKTATGISLLQQASDQRIDYIVRVFAETGVSELLRFLVELNQRYIDQPQVYRIKNTMLEVSGDDLSGEFDIDVNTEVGVGKRRQDIQNMQIYLAQIAPLGMQIGAVTAGEWAKAAQKLLADSGIRDPQSYVVDPEVLKQQFFMNMAMQMAAQAGQQAGMAEAGVGQVLPAAGTGLQQKSVL